MSLGNRIKMVRKDNKLTQREFADKLSVSRPFISRIEADKEKPSETVLKLISATFGIELNWLMNETGYKETYTKSTNKLLRYQEDLPLSGFEKIDFAECSSILLHLLNSPITQNNSERHYRKCIKSILVVLNSFFTRNDVVECEKEEIEAIMNYIERKIHEAIETFEVEDMNDK